MIACAFRTSIAAEFDALQDKDFENMLRTNVLGSIYPTYAVVPLMKRQKSGRIVFVSSQVAQAALHGKRKISFVFLILCQDLLHMLLRNGPYEVWPKLYIWNSFRTTLSSPSLSLLVCD